MAAPGWLRKRLWTTLYERLLPEKGICGPVAISIITGASVADVLKAWHEVFGCAYRGYTNVRELRAISAHFGKPVKRVNGASSEYSFPQLRAGQEGYARIQWLNRDDPAGRWGHFTIAALHTHCVALRCRFDGKTEVYGNDIGDWWLAEELVAAGYLKHGRVTSVYIVEGA